MRHVTSNTFTILQHITVNKHTTYSLSIFTSFHNQYQCKISPVWPPQRCINNHLVSSTITTQENPKCRYCMVYMPHLVLPQLSFNIITHNLRTLHAVTLYCVSIASCRPSTANRMIYNFLWRHALWFKGSKIWQVWKLGQISQKSRRKHFQHNTNIQPLYAKF
jgi:hypothetical protein